MTFSQASHSLPLLSQTLADAIAQAGQAVVAIDAGHRFSASGVHWQSGILVTTDHTLKREEAIPIVLPDQQTTTATLVGRDPGTDLAVLRLNSAELAVGTIADSAQLQVGHLVLAVGRSHETGVNASLGVISALGKTWRTWNGGQIDQFIRPDLSIYPGSSGSALINTDGQILGINTTAPRHQMLTIPAATINRVVNQLLSRGRVVRGYLGVGMQPVQLPASLQQSLNLTSNGGVIIVSVEANSPADQAGLLIGDVIVGLGDRPVQDIRDVHEQLDPEQVGQPLKVKVMRGGQLIEQTVKVGERPRRAD